MKHDKEYEIIEYLLKEAKEREKKIEEFEEEAADNSNYYYSHFRPPVALIDENMKKIRQLTLKIEGRV